MPPTSSHEPARPGDLADGPASAAPTSANTSRDASKSPAEVAKNFILNVSAALPKGVGDAATGRVLRVDVPESIAEVPDEPSPEILAQGDVSEGDVPQADATSAVDVPDDLTPSRGGRGRPKRGRNVVVSAGASAPSTRAPRKRRLPAWAVSVFVHVIGFAGLSLVTIAGIKAQSEMDLYVSPPAIDELQTLDPTLDPDAAADAEISDLLGGAASQTVDPGRPTLGAELGAGLVGNLTEEIALLSGGGGGAETGPLGGLGGAGGLFGDGTGGTADFGEGLDGVGTPEFFGTKIEGRRIVFVLDNSGSMQQGRLETVIGELLRSVEALDEDQEFYVVFYSDLAYPLFYPNPADNYVRPTPRIKQRLAAWLDTVELCLGDAVTDALAGVISIEPDVVFLLSDGRIQGEKKMAFLLQAGGGEFKIHTVGVGLGANADASRRNLQEIAAANGGDFREAAVPEEMRDLARDNPRPYHNRGPGPIWGRKVKASSGR
jgi:hypothetical protein